MSKFFYARLAVVNISKSSKIYLPYILSCIFTVAMFYIMLYISLNQGISQMSGAAYITTIMILGSIVIGIFSVIILLYTNSFLMKRRKKEIGLYNILGMGKNHIARVMTYEIIYVALISLVVGLFAGILFSKLMLMLLLKLLAFRIPFGFEVSPIAVSVTVALFGGIFLITLLYNLGRIHLSKPIELLYGGAVGEKEPKTKWLLAVAGILALGSGYGIALTIENPLSALRLFFFAVFLVIIGTYCLFTAGSIALLKALRRNRNYYYQTRHFTSVSGMLYRMKQNAVGLANICILSTMVLVMLSTTVSLYLGMEEALRNRFPRDFEITAPQAGSEERRAIYFAVGAVLQENGAAPKNVTEYRYKSCSMTRSDAGFSYSAAYIGSNEKDSDVYFIPLEEYNRLQGTSETLQKDELMIYSPKSSYNEDTASFGTLQYKVKSAVNALSIEKHFAFEVYDTYFFILPDETSIKDIFSTVSDKTGTWHGLSYYYGFDTSSDEKSQIALAEKLRSTLSDGGSNSNVNVASAEENKHMFLYLYGGLFFLGIFLGTLFIMANVIIMYYKQISEGYDDRKRFDIMQKVGLSRDEVKMTIRSQVLTVFFLPLAAAGIHIAAAFKMITKLLFLLNLSNMQLFAWCTLGTFIVFAVIYAGVYALTARTYYKIVS